MAVSNRREGTPTLPHWETLDLDRVILSYDHDSDTLMVHFFGHGVPAYSEPISDGHRDVFFLRISPNDDQVVGVQIEDFRARFVLEYPPAMNLLAVAELRGVDAVETARLRQLPSPRPTRPYLLASLLDQLNHVAA